MPLIGRIAAATARAYGLFSSIAQAVDPYFNYVVALLHGDGTNGGQNNTFLDSSTNNFTITRNGNTTQGSFSPFSQTGWSNYFDGTDDFIYVADSSAFTLGSGDFTVEAWVWTGVTSTQKVISGQIDSLGNVTSLSYQLDISSSDFPRVIVASGSTTYIATSSTTLPKNQWVHVAGVRDGSTLRIYVNGVQYGTQSVTGVTVNDSSANVSVGRHGQYAGLDWNGYISNFRLVKGTCVYPSGTTFTPPTTPLTAISGTSLLTCQSNRFRDASTNNFTITASGTPSVQPFSPFNPTTAYSTSSIGGSGYFDGSGDYLTVPHNAAFDFGSGDFTMEAWVYPTTASLTSELFDKRASAANYSQMPQIQITANQPIAYASATGSSWAVTINGSSNVTPYSWNHVALTRSGSTWTLWLNGTSIGTATASITVYASTSNVVIGAADTSGTNPINGYIAGSRIVKGTAIYTAAFTPPTAPLTAVSGTSLLLNYTNGAIFDNAAVADYETVGNAQISTSVKKYGTGSMSFDGTGDYLTSSANSATLCAFGTGDFTIEFWIYFNTVSGNQSLVDLRPSGVNGAYPLIYASSTSLTYYVSSASQINGGVMATGIWYHVAISRIASQTKMFLNGTQVGSTYADTNSYLCGAGAPWVGSFRDGTGQLNGYIDDLRITKSVGRYQYNFTPPTAEFPNIGGTVTLTADPYYEYTTLLLPGNGTNGAQNNTFLDSSTNAFTITRNGNTTQGTFSPFSQTGWGNYFDGNGDELTLSNTTAAQVGSNDFSIECFVFPTRQTNFYAQGLITYGIVGSTAGTSYLAIQISSTGYLNFFIAQTGPPDLADPNLLPINQWSHVVACRSGSTLSMFVNGLRVATTTTSVTVGSSGNRITIGGQWFENASTRQLQGYISNARIVKGSSAYSASSSTLTVPTAPLTAITNTSLLTCQSNRFIDNSTNAFAITANGDVSVQAFSPFNPTASWSAATYGGSGYFDGSGDYLDVANNNTFDTNSTFTLECFFYQPSSGNATFFSRGGGTADWNTSTGHQFLLFIDTGTLYWMWNNSGTNTQISTTAPAAGQWHHIAVGYNGTTTRFWLNGSSVGTSTTGYTLPTTRNIVRAGLNPSGQNPLTGYESNLRFVKGTDVYGVGNSTITVPTTPLTAITNTSLLLNYTNAGITDATSKNDLETVGNAQISTTQSKFGGSSMYFDGTGDYLASNSATTDLYAFGTGDFTIEFWLYLNSTSGTPIIYDGRPSATNGAQPTIYMNGAVITYYTNAANRITGSSLSASTWYHVAVCRYSSATKMFINGFQVGSTYTDSTNYTNTSGRPVIGVDGNSGNTNYFNGYIDDLRITKGIARYTSNFTPPTSAFLTL